MKVILLQELRGRGGEGDVINVADGFANNYLLRQGIAVRATKGELKQLEQRRGAIAKREEKRIADAESLREQLAGTTVPVEAQVGEEGVLFGSVTAPIIAEAIKAATAHTVYAQRRSQRGTILRAKNASASRLTVRMQSCSGSANPPKGDVLVSRAIHERKQLRPKKDTGSESSMPMPVTTEAPYSRSSLAGIMDMHAAPTAESRPTTSPSKGIARLEGLPPVASR